MSNIDFLDKLIAQFEKLPGVGRKTATRYAYYVVEKLSNDEIKEFAETIVSTKENICYCKKCGMMTDSDICSICDNVFKNKHKVLVVKDTKDALAIEKTNQFNGVYHVLGGLISPLDGVSPSNLNIDLLEKRVESGVIKELIIATPFTPTGETTAIFLEKIFSNVKNLEISRIGYGLPAGGDIEYVDELTLTKAIENRNIRKREN